PLRRSYYILCLSQLPPPDIYPLSLHDALPIYWSVAASIALALCHSAKDRAVDDAYVVAKNHGELADLRATLGKLTAPELVGVLRDRKSTRLNSSHVKISYAVFCLKKKIGYNLP